MTDRPDLEPGERDLDQVLSVARPVALPVGFRDAVMARVRGDRRVTWEWIVALLFAAPSLAFLGRQLLVHGEDFALAVSNIVTASTTQANDAFFFIDGLTVVALALLGIASAFAAHALLVTGGPSRRATR